jgi:ubiquinone/menaquinone biosynthesis C-methylase UbiE
MESQAFSVKRAQVEFHNFASLGEFDRAVGVYAEENTRRGAIIRNHLEFIGPMSPFLEIGANAGHTSYMLANEFGAEGFALDISADALRHGLALKDQWGLAKSPIRVAGDAANLPFEDGSIQFVLAFQMLSQFMNMESVFLEVKRVLAPGGIFLFAEEPLKRKLSARLYRCPYYQSMKPWERKLYDWGLLGYLVRDVIGAHQEESFGIRQNHTMGLSEWHQLITRHFVAQEYQIFVPERGWGERVVKQAAIKLDPYGSEWRAAHLLGGTLAAVCRKAGEQRKDTPAFHEFERYLRCPDCHSPLRKDESETLRCTKCSYAAANEGSVYNLLPAAERKELYPGDRDDAIDFSLPDHEARLLDGWYEVEGVFGNKYRWIGARASAVLRRVNDVPQKLRVRGHAHEVSLSQNKLPTIEITANGQSIGRWPLDRSGLFILEADVPDAPEYRIEISADPTWSVPTDDRVFSVSIGMIRLVPRE